MASYEITLVNILKATIFILFNVDLDFCYFFINIFQKMKSVVKIIGMEKKNRTGNWA